MSPAQVSIVAMEQASQRKACVKRDCCGAQQSLDREHAFASIIRFKMTWSCVCQPDFLRAQLVVI
jgi:hypothetical protein